MSLFFSYRCSKEITSLEFISTQQTFINLCRDQTNWTNSIASSTVARRAAARSIASSTVARRAAARGPRGGGDESHGRTFGFHLATRGGGHR